MLVNVSHTEYFDVNLSLEEMKNVTKCLLLKMYPMFNEYGAFDDLFINNNDELWIEEEHCTSHRYSTRDFIKKLNADEIFIFNIIKNVRKYTEVKKI